MTSALKLAKLVNATNSNSIKFPNDKELTVNNSVTLAGGDGKTLTVNNSVALTGTDDSTLNFGTGGTLGTAAYTNSTSYIPKIASLGSGNFNTYVDAGFYRYEIPTSNGPGFSYGSSYISRGADTVAQLVTDYTTSITAVRSGNPVDAGGGGVWQPWNYIEPTLRYTLLANSAAISTITTTPFFPASSHIPLVANAFYEIEFHCYFLKTTAATIVWQFVNSTTVANMTIQSEMSAITGSGTTGTWAAPLVGILPGQTAATVALPATGSLTTAVNHYAKFRVILHNGASTSLRLNMVQSVAGSVTPLRGSCWRAKRVYPQNIGTFAT